MSNNKKIITFFKKNAYYFVFLVALAVIVTATVILLVNTNSTPSINGGVNLQNPSDVTTPGDNNQENPSDITTPTNPGDATSTVVVFEMPVKQGAVIKSYVEAGVVYNQTLGLYSGHKAIDFGAE